MSDYWYAHCKVVATKSVEMDNSLHANVQVQMSGWWEVRYQTKDDWKFTRVPIVFGEQSARTCSTTLMLESSVIVLDTGWCWLRTIIRLPINSSALPAKP